MLANVIKRNSVDRNELGFCLPNAQSENSAVTERGQPAFQPADSLPDFCC